VIAEGPAGGLTSTARRGAGVALIAGGPGLAPVRALLQDMPGDIAVVCRGDGGPFAADLDALAARRGAALHCVDSDDGLSPERLRALVPDIADRDVFVCGPTAMVQATRATLRGVGVPARRISSEGFGP
jgi:ferredoxin-NADP reductase